MIKLSEEAFLRAKAYILAHGRSLAQAEFALQFDARETAPLVAAVSRFAHPEGGYDSGLLLGQIPGQTDVEATLFALERFVDFQEYGVGTLREGGLAYLSQTFQPGIGWQKEIEITGYESEGRDDHFIDAEGHWVAYEAGLSLRATRFLLANAASTLDAMQRAARDLAISYLRWAPDPLSDSGLAAGYDLLEHGRDQFPADLKRLLDERADVTVSLDPADWPLGSRFKPHDFVHSADSPAMEQLGSAVIWSLEQELVYQETACYWDPPWHWNRDPETWPAIELQARARLTLDRLIKLDRFGMIEGR